MRDVVGYGDGIGSRRNENDFAIFISGESLQKHIDRGSFSAADHSGNPYRVVAADIKVRINNWYKTKASLLLSTNASFV